MTPQAATELALIYAYPLLAFQKAFSSISPLIGVNHIGHARQLATATNRHVVKPNVDTLYSTAIFDLSEKDVIIQMPAIPEGQYALLSFYGLYGDNFAIRDKEDFAHTNAFHLSHEQSTSTNATAYRNGSLTAHEGPHIASPTTFGFLMVRWLVKGDNIDIIHSLQNGTKVETVTKSTKTSMVDSSDNPSIESVDWTISNSSQPERALSLLRQIGAENRPKPITENLSIQKVMEQAGLCSNDTGFTDVNLDAANHAALDAAKTAGQEATKDLNNGWSVVQSELTGTFGLNHGLRMEISSTGYLMLQAPYAVYPSWTNGSLARPMQGQTLKLGADESYIYTFSGKPALHRLGFWSLTAYDSDGYLIENSRNVFSLGDRSNLRYPSGLPIYGPGSDAEQDGLFQVLIQAADVTPPSNWTDNWLPGPSGGGNLTTLLRWYNAGEAVMDGTYKYPVITKQQAIRPNGSTL
ncbi:hypothetical protein Q7P37_002717 [Cladosporium fusiforme]